MSCSTSRARTSCTRAAYELSTQARTPCLLKHQPIKDFVDPVVGKQHVVVTEGQRLTSSRFLEHIASWYDIIVIYIEVDTNTAASRAHHRDGFDKEYKPRFLKNVMGAINNIRTSMPHNVRTVDGTQSADTVAAAIKSIVMNRL